MKGFLHLVLDTIVTEVGKVKVEDFIAIFLAMIVAGGFLLAIVFSPVYTYTSQITAEKGIVYRTTILLTRYTKTGEGNSTLGSYDVYEYDEGNQTIHVYR